MSAVMRALRWSPLLLVPIIALLAARCGDDGKDEGSGGTGGMQAAGGAGGAGTASNASCPATAPVHCSKCEADGTTCAFGASQCCVCTVVDSERVWYCVDKDPQCPETPATLDATCTAAPAPCFYCSGGKIETRSCGKGKWQRFPLGCG